MPSRSCPGLSRTTLGRPADSRGPRRSRCGRRTLAPEGRGGARPFRLPSDGMRGATRAVWVVGALALVVVSLETGLRLGGNSPDTRFTLPRYSLGYFWDTPLGWTSVVGGVPVNRDSLQFSSLAAFLRDEPAVVVPPGDNVYVRFAGYALVGSVLAPLVGAYASFVIVNVLFWVAAAMATYVLAVRFTREHLVAVLAALLVATAP